MRQKLWRVKSTDIEKSARLAVRLGIPPLIAQLLVTRGIETVEAANAYLYPTPADLHDPFAMPGMEKAVERIHEAIKRGEQIWIFGDYDADGTTAAALLLKTFRELDVPANFHIPDRFKEGYGLNEEAVRSIREAGGALMITVDCGIKSVEEVKLANELGLDVIITDHHQLSPGEMPPAHAMVTPKVPGSEYPFDGLAGVGLAFKLAHGLMGGGELTPF
jgi:single-stranded-DNA-specific exonuclease